MFAEDLLQEIFQRIYLHNDPVGEIICADSWLQGFLNSIGTVVSCDKPMSSKQSVIFLRFAQKLRDKNLHGVLGHSDSEMDSFLLHPRYRRQPYLSSIVPNEVRYIGDNLLGFRCKKIDEIISDIRSLGNRGTETTWKEHRKPYYDRFSRLWIVAVTMCTLPDIIHIIGSYDFHADDPTLEYLALADSSKGQPSTFVHDSESEQIIVNVCNNEVISAWINTVIFGEPL